MSKRTPPCPAHPEWTTAQYWSFIRSGLRAKFNKWPPKWECYKENRRVVTGKRHKYEYQCAACGDWWTAKDVEIDHITPAGSLRNYSELSPFVRKLFVPKNKLQVLCKACHKKKTAEERKK